MGKVGGEGLRNGFAMPSALSASRAAETGGHSAPDALEGRLSTAAIGYLG